MAFRSGPRASESAGRKESGGLAICYSAAATGERAEALRKILCAVCLLRYIEVLDVNIRGRNTNMVQLRVRLKSEDLSLERVKADWAEVWDGAVVSNADGFYRFTEQAKYVIIRFVLYSETREFVNGSIILESTS